MDWNCARIQKHACSLFPMSCSAASRLSIHFVPSTARLITGAPSHVRTPPNAQGPGLPGERLAICVLHIALMTISTYQHTIVSRHCFSGLLVENREQLPVRYIFGEPEVNYVNCLVRWRQISGYEYVSGSFTNFRDAFFADNRLFARCSRAHYCEQ